VKGIQKRKYIIVDGVNVCAIAWYITHRIPKSTFHNYIDIYEGGALPGTHGNSGIKCPRIGTVQIIDENIDQMSHQMHGIGNGRMDTLKFLLVGNNWK